MRRIVIGVAAALLTWVAVETLPVQACPVMDFCDTEACRSQCIAAGYIDGACIGRPCTTRSCGCLAP